MVIRTVKAATRKRTRKIRSNSHTGQYAGSISPDHSQGQTLGLPDASTSFFARPLKKGAVDLPYTPVVSIATGYKW